MSRKTFLFFLIAVLSLPLAASAQDEFIQPELNWQTIETKHFYVDYYPGEKRTAEIVAKIAEEIYGPMTKLYDHEPDQKVTFVIWNNDDYANGETYFYDNKINIWATSLDFDLRGTHNWLRNVVTHEFTHEIEMNTATKFGRHVPAIYLQWLGYEAARRPDVLYGYPNVVVSYPISGINIPAWFAEGVAQYNIPRLHYDYWDTHRDMILREYVLNHKMFTLQEMGGFGKTSLGNESTYNAGFAFVHYLSTTYGPDVLRRLSIAMRSVDALTINHAFEKVLHKSAQTVYDEWKTFLEKMYERKTAPIKRTLHAGKIISGAGFANLFPVFSPDGKSIAYCSNKGYDYFGLSSIYVMDLSDSTEKEITDGVASELSWSPDGRYLVYSKQTRYNPFWNSLGDIYEYDLKKDKESRVTYGLRARYPSLSADGKQVCFIANDDVPLGVLCHYMSLVSGNELGGTDGTANLYVADIDLADHGLSNVRRLTSFVSGQQVYGPRWSESSKSISFSYSLSASRRIGIYDIADSSYRFVTPKGQDSRNAVFVDHDSSIAFSSDRSGIFNIYRMNLRTDSTVALTNVLGGAFQPTISKDGKMVYSAYHWNGYKIAEIKDSRRITDPPAYVVDINPPTGAFTGGYDVPRDLTHYDDMKVPDLKSVPYHSRTTSLSIYPVLSFDNYNPHASFLDEVKAGFYFSSMDEVGKYDIFGGATINKLLERDIFGQFDYNDKIPGLSSLGIYPQFTLAVYNITRQTNADIALGLHNIPVGVNYDLLEVDASFSGYVFSPALSLSLGFTFDRYTSTVSGFTLPPPYSFYVGSSGDVYFLGYAMYAELGFDGITPSRNSWVNPLGILSRLRVTGSLDKLNADGNYKYDNGVLVPIYQPFNFVQAEFVNYLAMPLLRDDDAVATKFHIGYTFGPTINSFFDFYAGGLIGMKGYPFYAIGGNRMVSLNLTYRYPLFRDINKQFLQFYLSDIYLSAYGDVGNAWDGSPVDTKFKKDAGAELRLSGFSFYNYPTAFFFDAVYGFNRFSVNVPQFKTVATYGREWKFYFGLTFSFDIIDFGRQKCVQ